MSGASQRKAEAEAEVRALNALLERRVAERTAELQVALSNLHALNSQRNQAEAALRESELRYRRLVELSPEAVLVVVDDRLAYVNAAGLGLFGASDAATMLAIQPMQLVHPDDRKSVAAKLRRLAAAGEAAPQAEARLLRLDGSPMEAEMTAAGVTFDGRPAVQILVRDVGERKAMERMKDELLAIVSHELRTPLTSIRGSLGLLAGGVLGQLHPRGQRTLEIAVSNADRLIRLLNDVLDLERMRAGRMTLELRPCTAAELVEQAVSEMRGLADRRGVHVIVDRVEGVANADPDRMVQVLTNLLSNAVKFSSEAGHVRITATTYGQRVCFSVTDSGRGVPADKLDSIFERFQQVDRSDARAKGGAGLGLAICRSIVQQHDGRIWAESTLGQGSTFYVELGSAALAAAA
jgi:PAS domain S-box-containing protein